MQFVRRLPAAVLALLCSAAVLHAAHAQTEPSSASPVPFDVGEELQVVWVHPDSVSVTAASVTDSLRRGGYYFAHVDAIRTHEKGVAVIVSRGPLVRLGEVRISGVRDDLAQRLESIVTADSSVSFDRSRLEAGIDRVLAQLEREGRPLAEATVDAIEPMNGSRERLAVTLAVDPGPLVALKRIELAGAVRTSPRLIARLTNLEVGDTLRRFDPEALRRKLDETSLFETVGRPELVVDADTAAVIRIPIEEGDPGSFDLVLGYQPPGESVSEGRLVGNGHLALRNIFGGGRTLSLRLNRLPDQVSSVDVTTSDPYVVGLPLGIEARFHGLEQDSTYGKRSYRGQFNYHLASGMDVVGSFSREVTAPGQGGLRLGSSGRQIVPEAEAWFLGLGVRIWAMDRAMNPTSGMFLEMNLESGRKERTERRVLDADTTRSTLSIEQRRLQASGRWFVPSFVRQVLVLGGDAGVLLSSEYDRSDLFRFGGAATLRGYDEDRFLGSVVARALAEYRFIIDPVSFAYAFFDLGYVDRPETPDLEPDRGTHPGYGIGIQFDTAVGLVNVSAAINPESGPTEARIHAGLSFGL